MVKKNICKNQEEMNFFKKFLMSITHLTQSIEHNNTNKI